uniref:Uncharacterized protein n=1 Tax=Arundo donax TaxID=35708 RepID=A0A0A9EB70_ARUDO
MRTRPRCTGRRCAGRRPWPTCCWRTARGWRRPTSMATGQSMLQLSTVKHHSCITLSRSMVRTLMLWTMTEGVHCTGLPTREVQIQLDYCCLWMLIK